MGGGGGGVQGVWKNTMTTPASDCLRHFNFPSWNRWTEFIETWQEARFQRSLSSLFFRAITKKKTTASVSYWQRHFRLLLWNYWPEFNEIAREVRYQRSLCFSSRSEKQDGRPLPPIGRDIFYFSSERISTKVYRKQELSVLCQVCVFTTDRENKIVALVSGMWKDRKTNFE